MVLSWGETQAAAKDRTLWRTLLLSPYVPLWTKRIKYVSKRTKEQDEAMANGGPNEIISSITKGMGQGYSAKTTG